MEGVYRYRLMTILYHTVVNASLQLIVYGLILFLVLYWTREAVQGMYWIGGAMVASATARPTRLDAGWLERDGPAAWIIRQSAITIQLTC